MELSPSSSSLHKSIFLSESPLSPSVHLLCQSVVDVSPPVDLPLGVSVIDDSFVCLTLASLSIRVLCRSVRLLRRDGFRFDFLHEASLPPAPS
ncbi:hypothetical protein DY000_02036162 [Brassica cretica]|uniref:Uncharacterized protein n=1 Tax=Brassica cretica TaxID=69181 RepID=A0ABQ7BFX1_BRACR|nr:hypothetical protein DY000_02036162 [Brassica cretica]